MPRLSLFAFADDLALSSRSISCVLKGLETARAFGVFSGLQINQRKTILVSAKEPSAATRNRFDEAGWVNLAFVSSGVYLGLRFGRDVTSVEVFEGAYDKFIKRLHLFTPTIKSSSVHDRIIIFNVFLLPLFYYLAQFLVIPWPQMTQQVTALCRSHIIPFGGSAYSYAHLVTPRSDGFGFHTPLRDLWATNMTLLGWEFGLEDSHLDAEVVLGEYQWVITPTGLDRTVDCSAHAAYGAFIFLHDHAPRRGALIDLRGLPSITKPAVRRKWIYTTLALSGYWQGRSCPSKETSLAGKLGVMLKAPPSLTLATQVKANARICRPRKISPAVWNVQVRLTFHALPFGRRRIAAMMEVEEDGNCFFCGAHEDAVRHVYSCEVVKRARTMVAERAGCSLPHGLKFALLAFPPTSSPLTAITTIYFNWAVWDTRQAYLATLGHVPPADTIINRLVEKTLYGMKLEGSSAPRGEAKLLALANLPPDDAAVAFTDGSARPDGDGGAGFTVLTPGSAREDFATPLGRVDNNYAEMEALRGTFTRLIEKYVIVEFTVALIFSDTAVCLGYLIAGWGCPTDKALARETRRLYHRALKLFPIRLYWVRGHAGLAGNERADRLADIAAKGTRLDPSRSGPAGAPS